MRNDSEPLVFLLIFVVAAALMLALSLVLRYKRRELEHRERMTAIEKGVPLPPMPAMGGAESWPARSFLQRGLTWLFTGVALGIFLFGLAVSVQHVVPAAIRVDDANRAKANGATDEQVRAIMNDRRSSGMPPAVALIGLIPIGVGLAYLITYRSEQAAARR